jgi:hypothetical protein
VQHSLILNGGHKLFHSFKVFFWIGSRCTDYDKNFQETVTLVSEMQEKMSSDDIKLRFYLEYEYSESFQFFSLFKRSGGQHDLGIERCAEVSAIQYQDFYRQGSINTKESAMKRMI